ncbi:hypothetical protein A1O1_07944 [Capronia coronata CBS 617.96]|uniref:CFEM domain-containing protein n=1 Tax=Capronia coronata CBS 617.96 TaxID=1182541 RepID=W9YHX7_9EURO|nr:uncharacterized protein A1O1_07944 [Capronia coronata CBS 617.96]EXJ81879.1 hypothetical protein A1O1_07944 [Capronia coronata CBS 617.96]
MKTAFIVLALAVASQAMRVPLCSAICMTNAIALTGCSASDTACICTSERFFPSVAQCAEDDCNADKTVIDTAEGFCANAGIHVEVKRWGGGGPKEHGFGGPPGRGHWGKGKWKGGPPGGKWGFKGWGGPPKKGGWSPPHGGGRPQWGDWTPTAPEQHHPSPTVI